MAFGLPITIEHAKGSTRTGVGPDGKEWSRRMHADYGHIRRTEGTDGDELDVYVGPDSKSDVVFVISQLKAPEFKKFDEQKFMLGFPTAAEAKACYLKHYPNPKILGGMTAMTLDDFKAKAMNKTNHGKKLASHERLYVEMNLHLMERGEKVSAHVMGGPQAAGMAAQFAAERGVASPFVADLGGGADFMQYPRPGGGRAVHSRSGSGFGFKTAAEERRPSVMPRVLGGVLIGAGILGGARLLRAAHHDKLIADSMSSVARSGAEGVRALSGPRKKIAADRVGKIEDRLDDVGLTILGAPYAARGVANVLEHRGGRLGAIGGAARRAADFMHKHENKTELAGLALVAPGVIKPMAKGINKMLPDEKPKVASLDDLSPAQLAGLEKIASHYISDYEYFTEAEKLAFLSQMLGRAVGTGSRWAGNLAGSVQSGIARAGQAVSEAGTAFRNARSAAQHAGKIRGIQRARDYRVGVNQGAGTVTQAPRNSIVSSVNDRAQRIAEQRQALAQFRQSKGLGTSAERAAANRGVAPAAAKAAPAAPAAAAQPAAVAQGNAAGIGGSNAVQRGGSGGANTVARPAGATNAAPAPHGSREADLVAAFGEGDAPMPAPTPRANVLAAQPATPAPTGNVSPNQVGATQYGRNAVPGQAPGGAAGFPAKGQAAQIPQAPAQAPAAQAAANPAPQAAQAAQGAAPAQEMGIIDSLHSYLPQGTPRWAVPAALGVGGGLVAGSVLGGGRSKENSISLEAKIAALNARNLVSAGSAAGYVRPKPGFLQRLVGGGANVPGTPPGSLAQASRVMEARQAFKNKPAGSAIAGAAGAAAPAAAEAGQQAAQNAGPLISGKTIAKGALIGTLGLGLYGGKKVIDTGATLASGHRHITPAPTPDYGSVVL